jgi:hypothetical protein
VQAVGDVVFSGVDEVDEPADFGEGERDKASMGGWRGFRFGRRAGSCQLLGLLAPLFLLCVR